MSERRLRILFAASIAVNLVFGFLYFRGGAESGKAIPASIHCVDFSGETLENGVFVVEFDADMPVDSLVDPEDAPVVFQPALDHIFAWENSRMLIIDPVDCLIPGRTYSVSAAPNLETIDGRVVMQNSVTVETPEFALCDVIGPVQVDDDRVRIGLKFNGPVSPAALREFVSVRLLGKKTDLPLEFEEGEPVLNPEFTVAFPRGSQTLELHVEAGLKAAGSDRGLSSEVVRQLTVPKGLEIKSVVFERYGSGFSVRFDVSGTLSLDRNSDLIQVAPPVEGFSVRPVSYHSGRYRIQGNFKPRTFYRFTFSKGLESTTGQKLSADVHRTAVSGDLQPELHFATRGPYLPTSRDAVLPVRLRNIGIIKADAIRIFPNNLPAFLRDGRYSADHNGYVAGRQTLKTGLDENKDGTVNLPLSELIPELESGVYRVTVRDPQTYWRSDSRTVVLTDLAPAVTLTDETCQVWVVSLGDGRPVENCQVRIFSRFNQLLGEGRTAADGMCLVALGAVEEGDEPFCAVVQSGDDLCCVEFNGSRALTEFNSSGRPYSAAAYEAFVFTERGVCRPGEDIYVNMLVRDDELQAAGGFSAELQVTDPRGRVFATESVRLDELGFANFAFSIPVNAASGSYTVSVGEPGREDDAEAWGQCSFSVANYVADRIRVDLRTSQKSVGSGEAVKGAVNAAYYFGLPAAGNKVVLRTKLQSRDFVSKRFKDYVFGDHSRSASSFSRKIDGQVDKDGVYEFELQLPNGLRAPSNLELVIVAGVQDPGGRGVADTAVVDVRPYPFLIGLKRLWSDSVPENGAAEIAWVTVDPETDESVAVEQPLKCTLERILWDYVLKEDTSGNYYWSWVRNSLVVTEGAEVQPGDRGVGRIELPRDLPQGEYRLTVGEIGGGARSAMDFWLCQGSGGGVRPTHAAAFPLIPDRDVYVPGGTAKVTFESVSAGQGLLVVGDCEVRETRAFSVVPGENTLEFELPFTVFGSVYAAVTVVREEEEAVALPRRRFGFHQFKVDQQAHRLVVAIEAADTVRPETTVPVMIKLSDPKTGAPASGRVQVMAVDEGILALTAFETPAPFDYFFGLRRCAWGFFDVFDSVFPEVAVEGTMRSADGGGGMAPLLNPIEVEREHPAVVVLPPVDVDDTGMATVELPIPEHTGALRLMAVAFATEQVGSADFEVVVREPVSVLVSGPRAVAPGDEFVVTASVFNNDVDPEVLVRVNAVGDGAVAGVRSLGAGIAGSTGSSPVVAKGISQDVRFVVKAADEVGGATVLVTVEWNGQSRTVRLPLSVRPPMPPVSFANFAKIEAGTESLLKPGKGWLPGTGRLTLTVTSSPVAEILPSLQWLQQYPYACLEQSVSAVFPALVLDRLARAHGVELSAADDTTEFATEAALRRLMLMELPGGGFSMWPGGSWCWISGSVYALHFCAEVESLGRKLDPVFRERAVKFLRALVVGDGRHGRAASLDDRAYAGYVLALFGEPEAGLASGLVEHPEASPLAKVLAGIAVRLAGGGEDVADETAVRRALGGDCDWDMDSSTRRAGLLLDAMLRVDPECEAVKYLVGELRGSRSNVSGGWGTTQNNAVAVLALAKWMGFQGVQADSKGRVALDGGEPLVVEAGVGFHVKNVELPAEVRVFADGPGPMFVAWEERGVPTGMLTEKAARSRGVKLRRVYLNEDGEESTDFRQGDLVRVRIELEVDQNVRNLVVADLLPGGFEIEDASLKTRVTQRDESERLRVNFTDRRDDRFLLFCDVYSNRKPAVFEYTVRAVTPGEYAVPGISAEAMYEVDVSAVEAGGGRVWVK